MPVSRFFSEKLLEKGESLLLEGDELHHLATVTRTKKGEKVEIVNGKMQLAVATVIALSRHSAELLIESVVEEAALATKKALAIALLKPALLDWVVEKATESGITDFIFFPSSLSELKEPLQAARLARLNATAISAMKQCGRLDLPNIHSVASMQQIPKTLSRNPCDLFFGDVRPTAPSFLKAIEQSHIRDTLCFIGPGPGFTEKEVAYLEKELGGKGVRIARHILRAESASLAFATLIDALTL